MSANVPMPCPTCHRVFSEGELYCPYDRSPLKTGTAAGLDPLIGAVVAGRYTVLERLGAGGMGVVYAAVQHGLDRKVALKVLPPRFSGDEGAAERFRIEARAASQLTSRHTVVVHDFGATEDGSLFIAMQLLDGESLRARIRRGPLSPRAAVTIAAHVADSLTEAHESRPPIIHRDIKPDNVMVREGQDGEPFATVLDFGLARFSGVEAMRLTSANMILGTPAYLAPERCRGGPSEIDARVDLYSLGVVLFEMLTGETPFQATDSTSLLFKHVYDTAPTLRSVRPALSVPEALEALVASLLAKSPGDRPPTARVLRERLEAIGKEIPKVDAAITDETLARRPLSAGVSGPGGGPPLQPDASWSGPASPTVASDPEFVLQDRRRHRSRSRLVAAVAAVLVMVAAAGILSLRGAHPPVPAQPVRATPAMAAGNEGEVASHPPALPAKAVEPTPVRDSIVTAASQLSPAAKPASPAIRTADATAAKRASHRQAPSPPKPLPGAKPPGSVLSDTERDALDL
jgi:serine/threonine-protein kinase